MCTPLIPTSVHMYKALSGSGRALPGAVCPISRSDLSVQSGSPSVEHQSSSHGRPETRIKQVAEYLHCSGSWYELSRDIQYVSRNIRIHVVIVRSVQTITACKLVNWHLSRLGATIVGRLGSRPDAPSFDHYAYLRFCPLCSIMLPKKPRNMPNYAGEKHSAANRRMGSTVYTHKST